MLADFQNTFVRLATDQEFRTAFLTDAQSALSPYTLDGRERRALSGIPTRELLRFADSLLAKRTHELGREIPLTLRACPSLAQRYRRWLARNPAPRRPLTLSPGLAEALRALAPLRLEVDDDPAEAPYAGAVFVFEVLHKASRNDGEERSLRAPWRVDRVLRDLQCGVLPTDPDPAPTRYLFTREGVAWSPLRSAEDGR